MDILERLRKRDDLNEVFSPENYVFKKNELEEKFLKIKSERGRVKRVTKSQLRKYFNAFKSVDNTIKTNPDLTEEAFEVHLKKMIVTYPVMVSKNTYTRDFLNVVKETLLILYEKNKQDTKMAQMWFQRFIEFYETLIAYSRD